MSSERDKLQKLYFRIGEVATIVGVEPHVLRYWEGEFRSVRPQKSARGQRIYSRRDVETLLKVKELLYAHRFTIAGARRRLREGGPDLSAPEADVDAAPSLAPQGVASPVGLAPQGVASPVGLAPQGVASPVGLAPQGVASPVGLAQQPSAPAAQAEVQLVPALVLDGPLPLAEVGVSLEDLQAVHVRLCSLRDRARALLAEVDTWADDDASAL